MPRTARIDHPGLLQHVIARGVERRPIFRDDQDRERFLSRLAALLDETGTICYAWVFLENHIHLLLRPETVSLATLMRRLLTGYAVYFNKRHQRSGHLFQNRYKSLVCADDGYLLALVRYIHLNPIKAGVVSSLDDLADYPWCGHGELLQTGRSLVAREVVLSHLSNRKRDAGVKYLQFMADGLNQAEPVKLSRGGRTSSLFLDRNLSDQCLFDERILGGGAGMEAVLRKTGNVRAGNEISLDELIGRVAGYFGLEADLVSQATRERRVAAARAVVCHVSLRHLQLSGVDLSARLRITPSAVSHAAKRGRLLFSEDGSLQRAVLELIH